MCIPQTHYILACACACAALIYGQPNKSKSIKFPGSEIIEGVLMKP